MQRTEKLKLLDGIFNQSNRESLKSLSRKFCPSVLIYQEQGGGLIFTEKLNANIPARYQDKVMGNKEVNAMLSENGNLTIFLLPDNFRD